MAGKDMFDITAFKDMQLDTAVVNIVRPDTGEPTNIKIAVAAPDSEKHRQVSMRIQNEQLKFSLRNKGKATAERLAATGLELLVGVTVGWEGIAESGDPLQCTPENVRRVYTELPWIREQVDEFLGDRRNFFRS